MFFHLELIPSSGHCHSLRTCGGDSSLLSCAKSTSSYDFTEKISSQTGEIPARIEMKSPIPTAQHHFQFNSVPCALSLKAIKCVPSYTLPSYTLSRPVKSMLVKRFFLCWLQSDLLLHIIVAMGFHFFFQEQIS